MNYQDTRYLIISDLDGTLLNNNVELDPLTIKVVKELVSRGHVFAIVTGRPPHGALDIYKKLGLKHLMINFNGSFIWHPLNQKFLPINLSFNFDVARRLVRSHSIQKCVKNIVVENNDGTFAWYLPTNEEEKKSFFKNFHIRDEQHLRPVIADLSNIKDVDIHSILIQLKSDSFLDEIMYEIRQHSETLITRVWRDSSYGIVIEINSRFASKGKALEFLSSYYGISLEHCIAFGDGDNDAEMLQTATYGYAMRNATMTAKLYSRLITKDDNDEQGVARELIKFFGLKNME